MVFVSGRSCPNGKVETLGAKDVNLGVEKGIAEAIPKLCAAEAFNMASVVITHQGRKPIGWSASRGSVSGVLVPISWPNRNGIFVAVHQAHVKGGAQWSLLGEELFEIQLPKGSFVVRTGADALDRFAKDINGAFHSVAVQADLYSARRRSISQKVRVFVANSTPIVLTEDETYGLAGSLAAAVSQTATYLDLVGKYLYLVLFRIALNVDENSARSKRSYFREFRRYFYNPDTLADCGNQPTLTTLFKKHHKWLDEVHGVRDFLQHAGVVNPVVWLHDSQLHIDFSGGAHELPLHEDAHLSSQEVAAVLEGLNGFNEDLKAWLLSTPR